MTPSLAFRRYGPRQVTNDVLSALMVDGFATCRCCMGSKDHVPNMAVDLVCDHCGERGVCGVKRLLELGILTVKQS